MVIHIDIVSSVCDQVAAWQQAFLGEANLDRFRRAAAWTMSEVAKGAASGAKDAVEDAFENPTPWMRGVFGYKRALTRSGDDVSAELFVKPSQSIVLKYALGDDPQIRRPGDVGLAREKILVPHWRNLALTQGINRNAYGNLPGGGGSAPGTRGGRHRGSPPGRWL
ncbi:hypothetical protein [Methylorubrum salsuginis]|uniref:Uncharacterized protein n=1 Tax=Methylorubrum salsuginis TaxID=414703 RepID=A0A1I4N2Q7_9HYPH|nr:hypothetical protein [Methylorubrum salsuginis]SFM09490.1 hypothetical protein SAMN04488125_1522 [Methylorubrum salsuginis]